MKKYYMLSTRLNFELYTSTVLLNAAIVVTFLVKLIPGLCATVTLSMLCLLFSKNCMEPVDEYFAKGLPNIKLRVVLKNICVIIGSSLVTTGVCLAVKTSRHFLWVCLPGAFIFFGYWPLMHEASKAHDEIKKEIEEYERRHHIETETEKRERIARQNKERQERFALANIQRESMAREKEYDERVYKSKLLAAGFSEKDLEEIFNDALFRAFVCDKHATSRYSAVCRHVLWCDLTRLDTDDGENTVIDSQDARRIYLHLGFNTENETPKNTVGMNLVIRPDNYPVVTQTQHAKMIKFYKDLVAAGWSTDKLYHVACPNKIPPLHTTRPTERANTQATPRGDIGAMTGAIIGGVAGALF